MLTMWEIWAQWSRFLLMCLARHCKLATNTWLADTTTNLHTCEDVVLAREVMSETATQLVYTCKENET